MIVAIDLATLVACLALALAVHLYVRLFGREYSVDQRRAGRVDDFSKARASSIDGALLGSDNGLNLLPPGDPAQSDNALGDVPGERGRTVDAHRGGYVARTTDKHGEDTGMAAARLPKAAAPSQVEGPSTPRARSSRPTTLPATLPPTGPTRKETRGSEVPPASRPSKATSTSAVAPLPRQQLLTAFPPSIPGSPPPRQRLRAALPKHAPSSSAVKMEVDTPVLPAGQLKGKGRVRADSPVPAKVSFTTHRVPLSTMSTLTSLPTVSRSTTPGSSMTLLVEDDDHMEVDQVDQFFYKRIVKTRQLPLKAGQNEPDVLTFAWFWSDALITIVRPPPDVCLETPTVGDVFRHRVDKYTPPAYQLYLRVLQGGRPRWLEVEEGFRRDDGMYLIVTPSTQEVSWVGKSQYRSHMRNYGNFRSPLRQVTPAPEATSL